MAKVLHLKTEFEGVQCQPPHSLTRFSDRLLVPPIPSMAIAPMRNRNILRIAQRLGLCLLSGMVALMVLINPGGGAIAQGPIPTLPTTTNGTASPPGQVERRAALEATGIRLDGRELLIIASPAVPNRNEPGSLIPVEVRAQQIEANLMQLVEGIGLSEEEELDPNTMTVRIETVNEQPVLFVKDANLAEARVLLTVTDADAQYHAISRGRLAERWRDILEWELRQALQLRQPEALQQQFRRMIRALVGALVITTGLGIFWGYLGRRKQFLESHHAAKAVVIRNPEPTDQEPEDQDLERWFLQGLHHYLGWQQRLHIVRFLRWLVFWAIAFVWIGAIAYSLNSFPQTRQFAQKAITIPVALLIAWFVTGLTNRLTDFLIDRFIRSQEQDQSLTEANLQRIGTIARVIKGFKMVVVYTVAILWVLQWLNLVPGSILTLGALLALVISFAAQNLVKDLVNGFLILLEDQFRIGDYVRIGPSVGLPEVDGLVENLNLRITQLRSPDGSLISLSNSSIAQVENMSRTWARADIQIDVAYDTDVNRALVVVRETVDEMAQDPEWRSLILDTHEVFGVEQISHQGITIRLWIKTLPLKQWLVAREFRRRLKLAFDGEGIRIGIPQQIWLENSSGKTPD